MNDLINWLFIVLTFVSSIISQDIKVIRSIDEIVQVKPRFMTPNRVSDKDLHQLFVNLSSNIDPNISKIHRLATLGIGAARTIRDGSYDQRSYEDYRAPVEFCPFAEKPQCDPNYYYRTYDGSCNNLENSWWGSIKTPYRRLLEPAYNDGLNEPRSKTKSNSTLANPRNISMVVHHPMDSFSDRISNLVPHYGQYISHDLSLIQLISDNDDNPIKCFCNIENPNCMKIDIPKNDKLNKDQQCMTVPRSSASFKKFNCDLGAREQYNSRTHWLDHSSMYGHDISLNSDLRTFKNGQLKSATVDGQKLKYLPFDKEGDCGPIKKGSNCFKAGDDRVNQNPLLESMHTLWLRCHNDVASRLIQTNPNWDDEKTYQEARRISIALYQHITYNEWLPVVVGDKVATLYQLYSAKDDYSYNYDKNFYGNMINEFVTAAFRYGHSIVRPSFSNVDTDLKKHGNIDLGRSIFNNSAVFTKKSNIDTFMRSTLFDGANKFDSNINDVLNNHLFENLSPDARNKRLSLSSLNIMRGREHGLRPYIEYRQLCGLNKPESFDDLFNVPKETKNNLQKVYDSVYDIDLFTGGMSERPIEGGLVGATFACIISKQFKDLKLSDRYYYDNGYDKYTRFTPEQMKEIKKVTMSDLMCQYVDVNKVQKNAFFMFDRHINPWVTCDNSKTYLNYTYWKDYSSEYTEYNEYK